MRKRVTFISFIIICLSVISCSSNTAPINGGKNTAPAIVADFTFRDAGGLDVAFTDNSTIRTVIKSRVWEFGDGENATELNPTHRYATAGSYEVTLTLTDSKNVRYKKSRTITVSEFGVTDSLVDFSAQSIGGSTMQFNNNVTPTNVTIISRSWDFGDSGVSDEETPLHSYLDDGNYKVKLTLTDSNSKVYTITKIVAVKSARLAVGADSNLLLKESGELYNWGDQLSSTPTELTYFKDNAIGIKTVMAGASHTVAVSDDGQIYAWGRNDYGQLGIGSDQDQTTPTLIQSFPDGTVVKDIFVGGYHTVALTEEGKVYSWGRNDYGQLGIGSVSVDRCGVGSKACAKTPTEVLFAGGAVINNIIAGGYHNFSQSEDGKVYAWGDNEFGQLGLGNANIDQCGTFVNGCSKTPREVVFNEAIKSITAGVYHSLAISDTGNLYTWGDNEYGQLGFNNISDESRPKLLTFNGEKVRSATAGEYHTTAITDNGKVYAWGRNDKGQLGVNDNINRLIPERVTSLDDKDIRYIKSGYNFNIAVSFNDMLYSWGDSSKGQLGLDSSITDSCGSGACVKVPTGISIN